MVTIQQDEPPTGSGDGGTCADASGVGSETAEVRSERSGSGDGRVYHIGFNVEDGRGGECSGTVSVCVPHDRRGGSAACVDQGPLFDATAPCAEDRVAASGLEGSGDSSRCGLGFELAFLLPPLLWLRQRRRRAQVSDR